MTKHARGTFDVTVNREPPYDTGKGATLGRASVTKRFHGDLEGTSTVQMLSAIAEVKGSAGYVALERVVGALHGRKGTFVLQHDGTMNRGESSLTVKVVPDSGTDELEGLAGAMSIEIVDGEHRYAFDYSTASAAL